MNRSIQNRIQNLYSKGSQENYNKTMKCIDEIKQLLLNAYDFFQCGNMDAGFDLMYDLLENDFCVDMEEIEMYRPLKMSRAQLHSKIVDCLEHVGGGYRKHIAEVICNDVAKDLIESNGHLTDDMDEFISISVGRVLNRTLDPNFEDE